MKITTRAAQDTDRPECIVIEREAIQGIRYIDDVWQLFTRGTEGELTMSLLDGRLGGMGKLTRLYGGWGWLESLRVHPDYQGKGLGKAIYDRYLEQQKSMGLTGLGMYTGADNVVSRGLAEKYGLTLAGRFADYLSPPGEGDKGSFARVPVSLGEEVLSPHYGEMGAFAVVNRTWFPVRPGLGCHFAKNGWLYRDDGGNILVAGARFQPEKILHIPFFSGDAGACLAFAAALCREAGAGVMGAVREWKDEEMESCLTKHGFVRQPENHDVITLWSGL